MMIYDIFNCLRFLDGMLETRPALVGTSSDGQWTNNNAYSTELSSMRVQRLALLLALFHYGHAHGFSPAKMMRHMVECDTSRW